MIRAFQAPMTKVERIGLTAGLVLAAVLMWPLRHQLTDETFVHLQYAEHLAHGHGLVFNRGERVYGTTSPLWVTLIADGVALGLDGLRVARVLGVIATLASVALFLQLTRRTLRSPQLRALATLTWAGNAWMLSWSTSGLETPLAVALMLAGFVAFMEGRQVGSRPIRTGALWALAALTRPEMVFLLVLWAAMLIVDAHNRDGIRRLVFGMLPPLLIYGSWLLFARVYFGTFWPQTLAAATGGGGASEQLHHLLRQAQLAATTDLVPIVVLLLAVTVGGVRRWPEPRSAQEALPWIWILALPALYAARGVLVASRLLVLVLPVIQWLAWRAGERWWLGREPTKRRSAFANSLGVLVCVLALAQNFAVYRARVLPEVSSVTRGLERGLIRWGKWFAMVAPANAVIATPEIGAIGYFSERRILDLSGLVTPRMIPLLARETRETALANLDFATFARPEFVVDRAEQPNDLLRRSPHASAFTSIGAVTILQRAPRVAETTYTVYRVDWSGMPDVRVIR